MFVLWQNLANYLPKYHFMSVPHLNHITDGHNLFDASGDRQIQLLLTCYCRKSTGVTNNLNNGSALFKCPNKSRQRDSEPA